MRLTYWLSDVNWQGSDPLHTHFVDEGFVLAEAERVEAAASVTPPYDPADLSFSVDRLQEVV